MKRTAPLLALSTVVVALGACGSEPPAFADGDGRTPVDGPSCLAPSEGCPCDGEAPVECFVEHGASGGELLCGAGTRYCRGGAWGSCEQLARFTVPQGSAAIVGPVSCSLCDPTCNTSLDRPDDSDLTPGNSSGVVYDAVGGGVSLEPSPFEAPTLIDSDGDGVVDDADDCPAVAGDPRFFGCAASGEPGIYYELPFNGPAELEPCTLDVELNSVDVYFLIDTTGSMGGEISNLRAGLTSGTYVAGCSGGIIGAMDCTIPDIQFGVGYAEDYRVAPYGVSSDRVYAHVLDITADRSAAQTAVNGLTLGNGYDAPESQAQALWAVATGRGLGGYVGARSGCPAGAFGYPCFRSDAIPVVVLITDAPFHNGATASFNYSASTLGYTPPTWSQTLAALQTAGIRVIVIESANYTDTWSRNVSLLDFNTVATASGSVDSTGTPFVYNIRSDGSGLDGTVVGAIEDLANETRLDISGVAIDNPATAIDERDFVTSITAATFGPGGTCNSVSGNRFIACVPGTDIRFEIVFRNDVVTPHPTDAQVFDFSIRALYDDSAIAAEKPVRIVVPPENPCILAASTATPCPRVTGSYWRTHDASEGCDIPPDRPLWGDFDWTATTPADTSITFTFESALTETGIGSATPVSITVPTATPTVDVGALLSAGGVDPTMPFMRVTARLAGSLDHTAQPVLTQMQLDYSCITTE